MLWIALTAAVVVSGGTVHPVAGPPIEDGVLVVEGGAIRAVGAAGSVAVPADAERVDAAGLHVWPAMIDAHSEIGLREISSVRGTVDLTESGAMNPNVRAEVAINASSPHLPVTRANGVLLAAVVPGGSMVPGSAAAIALDGWTWEEMVRRAPAGLVIQWPAMGPTARRASFDEDDAPAKGPDWEERVARLDEMIAEARAYTAGRDGRADGAATRDADVRWESLRGVIAREVPVWISATNATQIRAAIDWAERQALRLVLVDGAGNTTGEAWRFAAELASKKIPVVTQTTRMPRRRDDPYDTPFAAPGKLHEAGVAVAFGTWDAANSRNLPQEAGRAVAYGMPRGAAERALTLGAAEVLGIADRYGSLEVGKSATFLVIDGDLLETAMQVKRAWLDGRELDLSSRHTELRQKWSARPQPER